MTTRRNMRARNRMSPLAKQLRDLEKADALLRPSVTRCISVAAAGPVPMTLPWPLTDKDWTGKKIER